MPSNTKRRATRSSVLSSPSLTFDQQLSDASEASCVSFEAEAQLTKVLELSRAEAAEEEALASALRLSALENACAAPTFPLLSSCLQTTDGAMNMASFGSSNAQVVNVLKATVAGDTRRLSLSWPIDADAIDILAEVSAAVVAGFALPDSSLISAMTYLDEEGDHCTLVKSTLRDFMRAGTDGVLRLVVKIQDPEQCRPVGTPTVFSKTKCAGFVAALPIAEPQEFSISTPRGQEDDGHEGWAFIGSNATDV